MGLSNALRGGGRSPVLLACFSATAGRHAHGERGEGDLQNFVHYSAFLPHELCCNPSVRARRDPQRKRAIVRGCLSGTFQAPRRRTWVSAASRSDRKSSWGWISRRWIDWNELQIRWNPHRNRGRSNRDRAKRATGQHCRRSWSRTIRSAALHLLVVGSLSVISSRHRAAERWRRTRGAGATEQRQRYRDGKEQSDHMLALSGASKGVKVATMSARLYGFPIIVSNQCGNLDCKLKHSHVKG